MLRFLKTNWIILIILLLAFSLRIFDIAKNPLYGDELTMTLDSYSILRTGRDELGNLLPLTFPMGAGRPAGYVYGSIPFIAAFGPSALGIRALSVLSGIGIVILLYFIGNKLFYRNVGIIAAAVGGVSIWDISLSRGGFEAHLALFLALLGAYSFIKAKQKPQFYLLSALSFGLTLHTYPTYKVSLLLFLPLLLWLQGVRGVVSSGKKYFFAGVVVLSILGILSLSQFFVGGSEARFSNINIFAQSELRDSIVQKINFERSSTEMLSFVSIYFHNKPVEYAKVLIENYLQNFSMDFLVLHGDRNPRHNMATMGEVYLVDLVLILIGFLSYWSKSRKIILFLLFWLILGPIPSAIIGSPHALRSSFMLPPLIMLSALGLAAIFKFRNKIAISLVSLFFIIQFLFFTQKLYFLAPNEYSNFWSYPAKLASQMAVQNKDKYDYIFLSDRIDNIEFAYPIYAKIDPNIVIFQNENKTLLNKNLFKKFDNIYIGYIPNKEIEDMIGSLKGSVLYIGSAEVGKFLTKPEFIKGLDGLNGLVVERRSNP